jgi:hypothetical protein
MEDGLVDVDTALAATRPRTRDNQHAVALLDHLERLGALALEEIRGEVLADSLTRPVSRACDGLRCDLDPTRAALLALDLQNYGIHPKEDQVPQAAQAGDR